MNTSLSRTRNRPWGLLEPDAWKAGSSGSEGAGAQQCAPATRGFHLHKVESWRWRGRYYLQRWPSDRAMAQIRARIREATSRRFVGHSIAWVVAGLNRVLRGWGAYFRDGNSARKFAQIDGYVHERLAIFASIKHGRHGRNYHRFTWGWFISLGVYLLSGRVRHGAAHALR
jgi:RNA-directed DNA polymerase